jgi:hypothetical protein
MLLMARRDARTLAISNRTGPTGFAIQPIAGSALTEVASFLDRQADRDHGSTDRGPVCLEFPSTNRGDGPNTERHLQWLLVDNPLATAAAGHSLCLRDASGVIMGLLLAFPAALLAGDRRLVGLGSGGFFVEPPARTMGFYLFKRHLNSPGSAFFLSTTCNANSAALWKALGACAVPNSDTEYVLPLSLEVLLPALLAGRTSSALAAKGARLFGRCAKPLLQLLARKSATLAIEPCRDWEKLAALFRRHRPADLITTDRSAAFLQWRYGCSAPNRPFDLCVFRDRLGHEGWFALGTIRRGRQGQIRGSVLLDAVWPREAMSFADILPAIVPVAASRADAIYLQPRPRLDYGDCSRWLIPWRLEAPKNFVVTPRRAASLAVDALDLVSADGDGAF